MRDRFNPHTLPSKHLLNAISDLTRWRILQTLLDSEPLPASEIARRLGIPATNISKHCAVLKRSGVLVRGFGDLYQIPPAQLSENGTSLDLGSIILRLADVKAPDPVPPAAPSPPGPAPTA